MNANGLGLLLSMAALCAQITHAAEVVKAPVPKSPYLPIIYRYADTMLERGRDTHGPQKTGLFLSALDRATLAPLTNRPPAPAGIREESRVGNSNGPLVGANPQQDQNLLRLLYTLSELSGKKHYREAADAELKWLLENAGTARKSLVPWGPHMSWNVMADEPAANDANVRFFRPWMLWDRCFELAPEASKRFTRRSWHDQITNLNQVTSEPLDLPRRGGFYIRTWAVGYGHTKDVMFLKQIETLLGRLEEWREREGRTNKDSEANTAVASSLSAAIDCDGAAHRVPEPLASRLREFASREDAACLSPHFTASGRSLKPSDKSARQPGGKASSLWNAADGVTTAQLGLMCVSRYDNTGKIGYRDRILASADAYLDAQPSESEDLWPMTFGHAISLQVAAWRHSANAAHLNSARRIADLAVEKFWGTNALPKASFQTDHYETVTGADTLALALVELHLNILHITAVRCPPNTIDR